MRALLLLAATVAGAAAAATENPFFVFASVAFLLGGLLAPKKGR